MSEHRYSIWQILGLLTLVLGVGMAALGGGVFLGYRWGYASAAGTLPSGQARGRILAPRQGLPFFGPQPFTRGTRSQPYLGVRFETITPELAKSENLAADSGALIREVISGSPAEGAGLKVGDIVQAVNGDVIDVGRTLRDSVAAHQPGDELTLKVVRGQETLEIKVTLAEAQSPQGQFMLPYQDFQMGPGFRFESIVACPSMPFFDDGRNEQPSPQGPLN